MGIRYDLQKAKTDAGWLGANAFSQYEAAQRNVSMAEEAYGALSRNLGLPGTYNDIYAGMDPGTDGSNNGAYSSGIGVGNLTQANGPYSSGIFSTDPREVNASDAANALRAPGTKQFPQKDLSPRLILDPNKILSGELASPQYRSLSYMVAEGDQLVREKGPLYERIKQTVTNPLIEGAAQGLREQTAQNIQAARQGNMTAGELEAQQANEFLQVTMQTNQAVSNAALQLKMWANDNMRTTMSFAQSWLQNEAGVRQSFVSTNMIAAEGLAKTSIAVAQLGIDTVRNTVPPPKANTGKIIAGALIAVAGVALSYYSGGAGMALTSVGTGIMSGGMGGGGAQGGGGWGDALSGLGGAASSFVGGLNKGSQPTTPYGSLTSSKDATSYSSIFGPGLTETMASKYPSIFGTGYGGTNN